MSDYLWGRIVMDIIVPLSALGAILVVGFAFLLFQACKDWMAHHDNPPD